MSPEKPDEAPAQAGTDTGSAPEAASGGSSSAPPDLDPEESAWIVGGPGALTTSSPGPAPEVVPTPVPSAVPTAGPSAAEMPPLPDHGAMPLRTQTPAALRTLTPTPSPRPAAPGAKRNILAGKFRLKREIAKGAMGRVFLAEQIALKREVAVKVLVPKFGGPDFDKRFMQEARAVASLSHPNIVTVHDYGRVNNNLLFMAMEFLNGPTLSQMVREHGAMSLGRACSIVLQIARALRAAHKAGMIHRDLKPGNVIVLHDEDEGDLAKVLDFGLAKMLSTTDEVVTEDDAFSTREGLMLGTPRYMAPEQITAKTVDERTDIYSLGAVFYHMAAGVAPFEGDNDVEILHAQLKGHRKPISALPGRENFPTEIQGFIDRCMATKKADRFATVGELIKTLKGIIADGMANPLTRDFFVTGAENAKTENQLLSATAGYGSSSTSKVAISEPGSSSISKSAIVGFSDDEESESSANGVAAFAPASPGRTQSTTTPSPHVPPPAAPVSGQFTAPFSVPPSPAAAPRDSKRGLAIGVGVTVSLLLAAIAVYWLKPFDVDGKTEIETAIPHLQEDVESNANASGEEPKSDSVVSTDPAVVTEEAPTRPRPSENGRPLEAKTDPTRESDDAPAVTKSSSRTTKSRRRQSASKASSSSSRASTASKEKSAANELGLIDGDEEDATGSRAATSESVTAGGVELVSPGAVDRAKAPTKKKLDQVKVGDVILADDYE